MAGATSPVTASPRSFGVRWPSASGPTTFAPIVPAASTAIVIQTDVMPPPRAAPQPDQRGGEAATTGMPAGVNGISASAIRPPSTDAATASWPCASSNSSAT